MMENEANLFIRVTDIKQWFYCPRVVYFTYIMPVRKKTTAKMEFGVEAHEVVSALERRRSLRKYNVAHGERFFRIPLRSGQLGLSGTLDMLIVCGERFFPVEFKDTLRSVSLNHKCQLAAYALLIEEQYSCSVDKGFLYQIPTAKVHELMLSPTLKTRVRQALGEIRTMITTERMPDPTAQKRKCTDCEFLRFCGDRF